MALSGRLCVTLPRVGEILHRTKANGQPDEGCPLAFRFTADYSWPGARWPTMNVIGVVTEVQFGPVATKLTVQVPTGVIWVENVPLLHPDIRTGLLRRRLRKARIPAQLRIRSGQPRISEVVWVTSVATSVKSVMLISCSIWNSGVAAKVSVVGGPKFFLARCLVAIVG